YGRSNVPPRTGIGNFRGGSVEGGGKSSEGIVARCARAGIPSGKSAGYADQKTICGRDQGRGAAIARSGDGGKSSCGAKADAHISTPSGQTRLQRRATDKI